MIYLRHLKEFSRKRSEVINELKFLRSRLIEHLLKLYYYRDRDDDTPGWVEEVRAYLGKTYKVKKPRGKDAYLPAEEIYAEVLGKDLDSFDDHHSSYVESFPFEKDENGLTLPEVSKDPTAEKFCIDYVKWASELLSQKGSVSLPEVEREIEKLWKKYPYTRV